jgi:hypothetical protein
MMTTEEIKKAAVKWSDWDLRRGVITLLNNRIIEIAKSSIGGYIVSVKTKRLMWTLERYRFKEKEQAINKFTELYLQYAVMDNAKKVNA